MNGKMSSSDRAVIYVDSNAGSESRKGDRPNNNGGSGSNYVIKIQIGDDGNQLFNHPVRIDVTRKAGTRALVTTNGMTKTLIIGGGTDSPLNSSGQSSPRSDMTPPPSQIINGIRFGSETSESDTESDLSATEYRPACLAAQFAMREICCEINEAGILSSRLLKRRGGKKEADLSVGTTKNCSGKKDEDVIVHVTSCSSSVANGNNDEQDQFDQVILVEGEKPGKSLIKHGGDQSMSMGSNSNMTLAEALRNKMIVRAEGHHHLVTIKETAVATDFSIGGDNEVVRAPKMSIPDLNGFHLNEIEVCGYTRMHGNEADGNEDTNGSQCNSASSHNETKASLSNFAGYKDIFSRTAKENQTQIMSEKGTIRGVKNRVRDGIATFLQSSDKKVRNRMNY